MEKWVYEDDPRNSRRADATRQNARGTDKGARLFCTTFPCHICARHIVAAGIGEVVYIEPYPKSRTADLFPDSIAVNPAERTTKVNFYPFVGVAQRRYFDLFELVGKRKDSLAKVVEWPLGNKKSKARAVCFDVLNHRRHLSFNVELVWRE